MRVKIYSKDDPYWLNVKHWITVNQNGLCHLCQRQIGEDDEVVSKVKRRTRYYHLLCAKLVNIV